MAYDDCERPNEGILCADAQRLGSNPNLWILRSIVVLQAVQVVDGLIGN